MYTESWEDYYDFSTTPPTPRNRKEITVGPEVVLTTEQAVVKALTTFKNVLKKKPYHE